MLLGFSINVGNKAGFLLDSNIETQLSLDRSKNYKPLFRVIYRHLFLLAPSWLTHVMIAYCCLQVEDKQNVSYPLPHLSRLPESKLER